MFAGEFATNLQSEALTCEFIDYNKHLQGTTIDCTIKNEVDRPDVIPGFRFPANNPTISRTQSTPFDSLFRNLKVLLSPKSINAFRIDLPAFISQQTCNPSVPKAGELQDEFQDPLDQRRLIFLRCWSVSLRTQ